MTSVELDSSALKSSVAFTGRLACMTRAEAFELVRQHGGTSTEAVTKRTKLLIVGEFGWPLLDDGRPSNKLSRATAYGIPVVSERRFLEWLGKAAPDEEHKSYAADQIATLSKLSNDKVQELARLGLLNERSGRFGFRDLASARQIAKLLADGVPLSAIIKSVSAIKKWLPDSGLANVRLHRGARRSSLEVDQLGGRTDRHGQFVLAVDESQHNADELFELGVTAEENGDIIEAERLYRIMMKSDPMDAAAPFNLGNMLRRCARKIEAEAALRAATRADPSFGEAWYNLSDLLDELGRSEAAIECLRKALQGTPDFTDAVFNLALLLQRKHQYGEAVGHWRRYLATDCQSEWAARARRSLKYCEMQVHSIAAAVTQDGRDKPGQAA